MANVDAIPRASELKGENRCFKRRERKIELQEGKTDLYNRIMFQRRLLRNWFLSRSLRNEEDLVNDMVTYLEMVEKDGDDFESLVPEKDRAAYYAVRSILKQDRGFDLKNGSYDDNFRRKAMLTVKLASRERYVTELIERSFLGFNYETIETALRQAARSTEMLLRYLKEEQGGTVCPTYPQTEHEMLAQESSKQIYIPAEPDIIDMFGFKVRIRPDAVKIDRHAKSIEAIKYCIKKPDLTKKGRKQDESALTSLEMFALWKYAKDHIPEKEKDGAWMVLGSSYFMGKSNDTSKELSGGYFTDDEKYVPIVSLKELLTPGAQSKVEEIFEPQVEEYRIGQECSEATCRTCDFKELCHYTAPPLKSEAPKNRKSVADIDLSEEQEDVVYFRDGIARVNAGAGAGKTLVVALRTAFMLSEGIPPEDILLVSFTNAAARELKERVLMYCEDLGVEIEEDKLNCMTFNSFGNELIKEEYQLLGFTEPPRLIDDIERKGIILDLLDHRHVKGLDYRNILFKQRFYLGAMPFTGEAFDIIKKRRLSSYDADKLEEELRPFDGSVTDNAAYQELLDLYEEYDESLRKRNLIEFADQERYVFDLLDYDPYYFDKLDYRHIVVDEFQDSSPNQLELVKRLVNCSCFKSLMIVGDDAQSIYGFRDACAENLIDFFNKMGISGEDFFITENHRSTPEILEFANKLNAYNVHRIDKDLKATRDPGKPVIVKGFHKPADEYAYIAQEVKKRLDDGASPEDIAVITFTKTELQKVAGALAELEVESTIWAPQPMLENSRVQAILSLCKAYEDRNASKNLLVMQNCLMGGNILDHDDADIEILIDKGRDRIRNIKALFGPSKLAAFDALMDEIAGDDDIALNLADRLKRFRSIDDKIEYARKFTTFGGESIRREGNYSGVILSTAHSSKGLEWPIIFNSITKYDDPSANTLKVEEMRRLFFVSATRARDELIVTSQYKSGGSKANGYSYNRYLAEACRITGTEYDWEDEKGKEETAELVAKAKKRIAEENEKSAKSGPEKLKKTPVKKKAEKVKAVTA